MDYCPTFLRIRVSGVPTPDTLAPATAPGALRHRQQAAPAAMALVQGAPDVELRGPRGAGEVSMSGHGQLQGMGRA